MSTALGKVPVPFGAANEIVAGLVEQIAGGSGRAPPPSRARLLKRPHVYRLELAPGGARASVILKRLDPSVGHKVRLLSERWLPTLGLEARYARLLGVAAEPDGGAVWHAYEDLGSRTLHDYPDGLATSDAIELVSALHTRAMHHPVLPEAREQCHALGPAFLRANVEDARDALEALAASGIEPPPGHHGLTGRLRARLERLLSELPQRTAALTALPDTLLHGDLWLRNIFVGGAGARLIDWDKAGVGPTSYDLSTLLMRFARARRPYILARYRRAAASAGYRLPPNAELEPLLDTAERARYANRVVWPALALVRERVAWGFPELAEVERWFEALDAGLPILPVRTAATFRRSRSDRPRP